MKTILRFHTGIAAILCLSISPTYGDQPTAGSTDWFSDRQLSCIGFVVLGASYTKGGVDVIGCPKDGLHDSDTGWNPQIRFRDSDGNAISKPARPYLLMRIQDRIDSAGKDAGTASFSVVKDYQKNSDTSAFNGAVIFDLYTPGIGESLFAYDADSYGFHFRGAAQFDHTTANGTRGTDRREYYFGMNFLAPVLSQNGGGFSPALGSTMDIGFKYAEDRITGDDSTSVSVQWKPLFRKLFGREIPLNRFNEVLQAVDTTSATTPSSAPPSPGTSTLERVYKDSAGSSRAAEGATVFFQPTFELENFFKHAVGQADGICGCAGLDAGINLFEDRLRFTYSVNLAYDFENSNDFVFHSAGAELKPLANSAMSITAKYVNGERAPSYTKEERFEFGIGLRF